MKKITIPLLLFLLIILSSNSNAQLQVIQYKLDNGFTVILNPDKTVNEVYGAVAVNTGSKNDPADATGMSHYLEHLLFKGTAELGTFNYEAEKPHLDSIVYYYDELNKTEDEDLREKVQLNINKHSIEASKYAMPNEFDKLLKSIGSTRINATTSRDLTIYFNSFPAHQIYKWLDIYAHRFQNPVFRSFQSELEVVYEEKNRAMDNMQRRLFGTFDKHFYKGHPYGEKSTLGTVEHLKNPSLTKMYQYFEDYYVANNMALILSGNFEIEEVKPSIQKLFGQFRTADLPVNNIPTPEKLNGRVLKKERLTPIKAGLIGFRTVPRLHPDELALEVASLLLQNESRTGLVDDLENSNQLMNAWAFQENEDEAGQLTMIFIPKILRQSLKSGEKLMLEQLEKLKNGEFTENQLQAVKNAMYNYYQREIETPRNRGYYFSTMFRKGIEWEEMQDYPNKLDAISKADIQSVAKKYFGNDYLIMHSRTGFPKKPKLNKPKFNPVKVDQSKESEYAKKFKEIEEKSPSAKYIEFDTDLDIIDLGHQNKMYVVKNPINDIYELSIQYGYGLYKEKDLVVLAELMNQAYPEGSNRSKFKEEINLLGSNYNFSANSSNFELTISGIEKNLKEVVQKLNDLMQHPKIDNGSMKVVSNRFKTNYKAEKEEANFIATAMAQYGFFGENSIQAQRSSAKEISKMSGSDVLSLLDKVKEYAVNIHFTGITTSPNLKTIFSEHFKLSSEGKSEAYYVPAVVNRISDEVVLLNNKKLVQSTIFITKSIPQFNPEEYPQSKMFNAYFGGGFSGIIKQEIREYRSLAYVASAAYRARRHKNSSSIFYTYIACQSDKTNEALNLGYQLVNDMPKKEDRIELIRSNVKLSQFSSFPGFRNLSSVAKAYMDTGYTDDPNKSAFSTYNELEFDDLYEFYVKNIQSPKTFVGIYGDSKRFNTDELEKLGKLKRVKLDEIIKF